MIICTPSIFKKSTTKVTSSSSLTAKAPSSGVPCTAVAQWPTCFVPCPPVFLWLCYSVTLVSRSLSQVPPLCWRHSQGRNTFTETLMLSRSKTELRRNNFRNKYPRIYPCQWFRKWRCTDMSPRSYTLWQVSSLYLRKCQFLLFMRNAYLLMFLGYV